MIVVIPSCESFSVSIQWSYSARPASSSSISHFRLPTAQAQNQKNKYQSVKPYLFRLTSVFITIKHWSQLDKYKNNIFRIVLTQNPLFTRSSYQRNKRRGELKALRIHHLFLLNAQKPSHCLTSGPLKSSYNWERPHVDKFLSLQTKTEAHI